MAPLRGVAEQLPSIEKVSISAGPFGPGGGGIGHTLAIREPAGVVAAITPFNYPFLLNIQKLGAPSPPAARSC